MTDIDAGRGDRRLRIAHRATLVVLAVCALWAMGLPTPPGNGPDARPPNAPPDTSYTLAAIGLAMGSILCRQRAAGSRSSATRYRFSLARFAFAAGMGVLGLSLASGEGLTQVALLYCLAAAILALRPPGPVRFDADETAT